MANVKVEEQALTDIADALRGRLGNTKTIQVPGEPRVVVKVSKTKNALSFTEKNGPYSNYADTKEIITIPGATNIHIDMAYETDGPNWDYVKVYPPGASSSVTYGGNPISQKTFDFAGDAVVFEFHSDSRDCDFLGYYAEITGFDAEGKPIMETPMIDKEIPNVFKPAEMGPAISNLPVPNLYFNNYAYDFSGELISMGSDWIPLVDERYYARDYDLSRAVSPGDCNWMALFNTYDVAGYKATWGMTSPMFDPIKGKVFDPKKNELQEIGFVTFNLTDSMFGLKYDCLRNRAGQLMSTDIEYNPISQVLRVIYQKQAYQRINKDDTLYVKVMPASQRG